MVRPSSSVIEDVSAVSVCSTCGVPLMVGAPAAGVLALASTVQVAALVSDSSLPRSSVNETFTLMVWPWSASARVWVEPVPPAMSASSVPSFRTHWYR